MKKNDEEFDDFFVHVAQFGIDETSLDMSVKFVNAKCAAHLFFQNDGNIGLDKYNIPLTVQHAYNSDIGDRDPYVPILFKNPNIEVFHARSVSPPRAMADKEFIGEIYEPMGTTDILGLTLSTGSSFHALTLTTDRQNGYTPDAVKTAGLVHNTIRRALHVGRQRLFRGVGGALPSPSFSAVFLLLDGKVTSINAEGEHLARLGIVSIDGMSRLRFSSSETNHKLREVVRGHAPERRISISATPYNNLAVSILRLPKQPIAFALGDSSIVLVIIENLQRELDTELLESVCALTETEKRIASVVLEGITPAEIAFRGGVKVTTVNFHLKNLREKLDAASHASLLATLQKFTRPGRIIPNPSF